MTTSHQNRCFFWLDLEMTGLDEKSDHILEVAAVVTDLNFVIREEWTSVVLQPPSVLENMNDWCKEHHGKSGLTAAVSSGKPLLEVESELLRLLDRHFQSNDRVVLCGNSIGNDRRFIDAHLPRFAKRLHYRMVDVSSFKEIFRDKFGMKFEKANAHRALGDIHESIRELQAYLSKVVP